MAEPLPPQTTPEAPKPQTVTIGETPVFLTEPVMIDGQPVTSFTVLGKDQRAASGVGSAVILTREPSRKKDNRGELVDKENLNFDRMDVKNWDEVSGIRFRDEAGNAIDVPKEKLGLEVTKEPATTGDQKASDLGDLQEKPGETPLPPEAPLPETPLEAVPPAEVTPPTPPKDARAVLESLSGVDPNMITIVGLKAYETRALDLADRSMQKLLTENKSGLAKIHDFLFTTIWKQSIGGIYFHEKARQYYMDMLQAAETPFAEDAIRLAERRATDVYNKKLADSNFLVRAGTSAVDWLKDKLGMRSTIQTLALEEIGRMKASGEIAGMETLEREAKAVRMRFGTDFDQANKFIRKQLGEKLEILDPTKSEHQPLVEGIQTLLKQYASGEIADKAEFDTRTQEFFKATLKNVRPDIFAEAELYSSSLFDVAETLRAKISHEGGMANIDDALSGMHIRLGLGSMGEVTSLDPTAVEKGIGKVRDVVEWLNRKHVIVPMLFNEATVGSAVAIVLSAGSFLKTTPARILGGLGGGALAGGIFAGWREYGQLQKDYLTHLRERETGATFTETQKRRQWFERFAPKQRSASEMSATLQSLYDANGVLRVDLTQDELRNAMATIADLQARKAVSETGPKRIGLVQYSSREAIESERTALDLLAGKALGDLGNLGDLGDLLGGNTFPDFMEKLTVMQTRVLREGVGVLTTMEDPVNSTLNLVSQYAPEATMIKRRWSFAGRVDDSMKVAGLDAIMEEFKKEARLEAVTYGVKAGVIGAAVGVAIREVGDLFANREVIGDVVQKAKEAVNPDAAEPYTFTPDLKGAPTTVIPLTYTDPNHTIPIPIGGHEYQIPDELSLQYDQASGSYDAFFHHPDGHRVILGDNIDADHLKDQLAKAGLRLEEGYTVGDPLPPSAEHVPIENLTLPNDLPVTTQMPDGWKWVFSDKKETWALIDTHRDVTNQTIASNITFDEHGGLSATELAELKSQIATQFPNGFVVDTNGPILYQAPVPAVPPEAGFGETPSVEVPTSLEIAGPTMTIEGKDMSEGGVWDYFLSKTHDTATANGMKNLFRLYEHQNGTDNITFGENDANPYDHAIRLREATLGSEQGKIDIDLTHIPNDAHIKLPESIFGQSGIEQFSKLNDAGIARINELIATGHIMGPDNLDHVIRGPGDAINYLYTFGSEDEKAQAIALKLGYWGEDKYLPNNPEDLNLLYEKLGATVTTTGPDTLPIVPPVVPEAPPTPAPAPIHELVITATRNETVPARIVAAGDNVTIPYMTPEGWEAFRPEHISGGAYATEYAQAAREAAAAERPWYPVFIPYRAVLEAAIGEVATTAEVSAQAGKRESVLSPFGMEEQYIDKPMLDERKSPRLKEDQAAKLNQQEEIAWYLEGLTAEEKELIAKLSTEIPPVNPELRVAVVIPSSSIHGGNVYQRLTSYAAQTNADGTPLDPKKTEFIVYDSSSEASTKADAEKFLAEHPDLRVVYVNPGYTEEQLGGKIKRDATNLVMSRIATLPTDAPDVMIAIDRGQSTTIEPTYVSSIIKSFDTNPALDAAGGMYTMPAEAYATYPMLFASQRAFEIFDGLVRHGESDGLPATYIGNLATRAGTLAAVGGYSSTAKFGEDAEVGWMVKTARGNPESVTTLPSMTATFDAKELSYAMLQEAGMAEKSVPLAQNETYKDLSWQDMTKRLDETVSKEQVEAALTSMYQSRYPTLRANHPERFDAYFRRTLDTLGLQYELTDGKVTLTNTDALAQNMATPIELEAFTKDAAAEVVAATPKPAGTPREHLETLAGDVIPSEVEGTPTETLASGVSSPNLSSPIAPEVPQVPQPESLPTGVEDRMNYVLTKSKENSASVQLSPGELMDYVKTSVELPGARITEGHIQIEGDTVTLSDMKAKTIVGEAEFSGTLITDPAHGLVVKKDTLKLHLPLLARPWQKGIHESLDNFNNLVLTHVNTRIDPKWKAQRIDVVGEKLEVKFTKKA